MQRKQITALFIILFAVLIGAVVYKNLETTVRSPSGTAEDTKPQNQTSFTEESINNNEEIPNEIQLVAQNLDIPWEITFLPDNSLLVTERPGTLLRITPENNERISVEGVEHIGEGGLLGLALHPNYDENNLIYLYLTTRTENGLTNRVDQYLFNSEDNQIIKQQTIIENIPGANYHDGGRIAFGPDEKLYITTGDAGNPDSAQNTNSLAGKILRLNSDGSIPEDNLFDNEVYSYGHRNPQGLAWDSENNLWATEHGPSGVQSGFDEVNLIEPGNNYGWPAIRGNETQEGMVSPIIQSGANETWAPAGAEWLNGNLFYVGLRGETLYKLQTSNNNLQRLYKGEYGRLRIVKKDPTGNWLYIATSNTDGRGSPKENDDRIIRIPIETLMQ